MANPADTSARARGIPLIILDRLRPENVEDELPGYLAISTATANVEDAEQAASAASAVADTLPELPSDPLERTGALLSEIAARVTGPAAAQPPEIVIAVHGFSNNFNSVRAWYQSIHRQINADPTLNQRNALFIGYRWPSENVAERLWRNFTYAFSALPILPRGLFLGGAGLVIGLALAQLRLAQGYWLLLFGLIIGVAAILPALILALIIMRLVVYFRDAYRAAYFGTPDLVELIRQLDQAIHSQSPDLKVKLSFLGHSMGCSVIVNTLRILSDVFEPGAIGYSLNAYQPDKQPTHDIGRVFQLERLVLVAPDIPVESVIPRRSNFLRSALRRVKEAHVFTNEGDLALRLASTAANYFSFPARTRFSGYRLGNLTVRHFQDFRDTSGTVPQYGIINPPGPSQSLPFQHLEIRSSNREHRNLEEDPFYPWIATDPKAVTNRFTYYDCTDYQENQKGVVSLAVRQPAINLCQYTKLLLAYLRSAVDTHGGYFRGAFSQDLIYRLAFAGFQELCQSLPQTLHEACAQHQIQVLLSPLLAISSPVTSLNPAPPAAAITPVEDGVWVGDVFLHKHKQQ